MLCVPSARHVFGTASLASSALSASAELLVCSATAVHRDSYCYDNMRDINTLYVCMYAILRSLGLPRMSPCLVPSSSSNQDKLSKMVNVTEKKLLTILSFVSFGRSFETLSARLIATQLSAAILRRVVPGQIGLLIADVA